MRNQRGEAWFYLPKHYAWTNLACHPPAAQYVQNTIVLLPSCATPTVLCCSFEHIVFIVSLYPPPCPKHTFRQDKRHIGDPNKSGHSGERDPYPRRVQGPKGCGRREMIGLAGCREGRRGRG